MGILNVTPDSFSDGGNFLKPDLALAQAKKLIDDGADILDIGGESTRPGAEPVTPEEEISRISSVFEWMVGQTNALLSIDTRNAAVMRAAVSKGAHIINDVSALSHDPESLNVAAESKALVILMHMRGTPETMDWHAEYDDVVTEVIEALEERVKLCISAGIGKARIALDPGIGFAKTPKQNLTLLENLGPLVELGYPVVVGASRKLAPWSSTDDLKLSTSITAAANAADQGAAIVRIHDVAETRAAISAKASAQDR
jgi:dihydropteroate synthase